MAQITKEYASALFELALETGSVGEISEALETVLALTDENPEYLDFLSSPNIPKSERISSLEQAFGTMPEYVVSFLSLLCERGRIRSLAECVSEFKLLCDAAAKVSVAEVVSAVGLDEKQKTALAGKLAKLCGHDVVLQCSTDESLLGGIVVRVDDKVIDGSLKNRLHELKEVMNR